MSAFALTKTVTLIIGRRVSGAGFVGKWSCPVQKESEYFRHASSSQLQKSRGDAREASYQAQMEGTRVKRTHAVGVRRNTQVLENKKTGTIKHCFGGKEHVLPPSGSK